MFSVRLFSRNKRIVNFHEVITNTSDDILSDGTCIADQTQSFSYQIDIDFQLYHVKKSKNEDVTINMDQSYYDRSHEMIVI